MNSITIISIISESDIVKARQTGRDLSRKMGFSLTDQARITTGISELARNILLYAGSGEIKIRIIELNGQKGIEIIAEDKGPGIKNIKQAMLDGFSTSKGLGMGLPGTKRLMDELFINSTIGIGTQVITRKWAN